MLEMILRINGFGLIQDGEVYRVIPLKSITHLPMRPEINQKNIPEDDQTILNLVFLEIRQCGRVGQGAEVSSGRKLRHDFLRAGESAVSARQPAQHAAHHGLIAEFDSDTFANQRVRLFEVTNVKPSDVVKDLDNIFKSISLDSKTSTVRFLPVDRINTLIAVAPNPGVFDNDHGLAEEAGRPGENFGRHCRDQCLPGGLRSRGVSGPGAEQLVQSWIR